MFGHIGIAKININTNNNNKQKKQFTNKLQSKLCGSFSSLSFLSLFSSFLSTSSFSLNKIT